MSEFEHSITINASSEQVFDYITDIRNMPDYMPTVREAMPQGSERVRLRGEVAGHSYDSDGHLHVDHNAMRMEWGSDGENQYRGWLQVADTQGKTRATVHLSFVPRPDMARKMDEQAGDHDLAIQEGLEKALVSIRNKVEGVGGKVEPASV